MADLSARPEPSSPRTLASALSWVARQLSAAGIERARPEAEVIISFATGRTREGLLIRPDTPLSPDETARLTALAQRRARREPLPYVLGEVEFYSSSFHITPAVMVPRPETEILVEAAIARAGSARLAVDVGTGCGAVAIALARELTRLRVVAVDISGPALALARRNCQRHGVSDRVLLVRGDLLGALRVPADFIIANLPYIRTADFPELAPEVRDWEPRIALDGGDDGLAAIRRLSVQLFDHLCPGGCAALEVGAGQAQEVANLLARTGLSEVEVLPDYAGIQRVVIGRRKG
jgi:release factor glutamine methyltransferase